MVVFRCRSPYFIESNKGMTLPQLMAHLLDTPRWKHLQPMFNPMRCCTGLPILDHITSHFRFRIVFKRLVDFRKLSKSLPKTVMQQGCASLGANHFCSKTVGRFEGGTTAQSTVTKRPQTNGGWRCERGFPCLAQTTESVQSPGAKFLGGP